MKAVQFAPFFSLLQFRESDRARTAALHCCLSQPNLNMTQHSINLIDSQDKTERASEIYFVIILPIW